MALNRDQILGADDLPTEELEISEWGGTVLLKALNGEQREEIEVRSHKAKSSGDALGWKGLKTLVATYALVDDEGKPLFTAKDLAALAKKSSAALDRIFEYVMKMNAMTKADAEELAGN